MSIHRLFLAAAIAAFVSASPAYVQAQGVLKGKLGMVKSLKCAFSLVAVSSLGNKQPEATIKPATLILQFESINADEGTAQMAATVGQFDIIVRYAGGYLHFIQSYLDGPLYTTTVLEKTNAAGKLKAMHSRHEHTDFALPGFTSSPEQYYGECEILN